MEKDIVAKENIPFFQIPVVKFDRINIVKNLKIPFELNKGIKSAEKLLAEISPDVVFTKGGYASVPVALASKKLDIPVATHESDQSLGLANKLIASFAKMVFVSNPNKSGKKELFTGNPVRQSIFNGNPDKLRSKYKFGYKPTVLITGGSLGAVAFNDCVKDSLDELLKKYNVVHIVGKKNPLPPEKKGYVPIHFADNIEDYFALSDIVVTRAGAGALTELTALGKKTIAIPLPKSASRGDQLINAERLYKEGYINLLYQQDLTPKSLVELIDKVYKSPSPKKNPTGINAGRIIAEKLNSIAK